jgi:IS30 family transposase
METTKRQYRHLSAEQRAMIAIGMRQGQSMPALARLVGCSVSTVSRELRRNEGAEAYEATAAGLGYRERRRRGVRPPKLVEGSSLWRAVDHRLRFLHWSPEQIAATLRAMHPRGSGLVDQPRDDLRGDLRASSRVAAGRLNRGPGPAQAAARPQAADDCQGRGLQVPDALRIAERPEDVTARKQSSSRMTGRSTQLRRRGP